MLMPTIWRLPALSAWARAAKPLCSRWQWSRRSPARTMTSCRAIAALRSSPPAAGASRPSHSAPAGYATWRRNGPSIRDTPAPLSENIGTETRFDKCYGRSLLKRRNVRGFRPVAAENRPGRQQLSIAAAVPESCYSWPHRVPRRCMGPPERPRELPLRISREQLAVDYDYLTRRMTEERQRAADAETQPLPAKPIWRWPTNMRSRARAPAPQRGRQPACSPPPPNAADMENVAAFHITPLIEQFS